jgi:hypothetical protein
MRSDIGFAEQRLSAAGQKRRCITLPPAPTARPMQSTVWFLIFKASLQQSALDPHLHDH